MVESSSLNNSDLKPPSGVSEQEVSKKLRSDGARTETRMPEKEEGEVSYGDPMAQ